MEQQRMSDEAEAALQSFKEQWIGKHVKIVGINHPWKDSTGEVVGVDYTNAGWGLRIDLDKGNYCYAYRGTDLNII